MAYLKLVLNKRDDQSLLRVIGVPPRGIGDKAVMRLRSLRKAANTPMQELLSESAFAESVTKAAANSAANLAAAVQKARDAFSTPGGLAEKVTDYLEEVGYLMKHVSDEEHKELKPDWVYEIFKNHYIDATPHFEISECHYQQNDGITAEVTIREGDRKTTVTGSGNGRLDAVSRAIKDYFHISYQLSNYEEHALTQGSSSKAIAYVNITCQGDVYWGVGINEDIIKASVRALCVCVNKLLK